MESSLRDIYLDYNSTCPLEDEVLTVIHEVMDNAWGNPSSSHVAGVKAKNIICQARCQVAQMIGASESDIIFTSGGTEANNMVLRTVVGYGRSVDVAGRPHVITSTLEHDSINLVLDAMKKEGLIDVTYINTSRDTASIIIEELFAAIQPNTCLITVMLANNETGVIQPVGEIGRLLDEINKARHKENLPEVLLHTDAAQAIGKVRVDVKELGVDYLTIVGHKFYGPRVGALYIQGASTPLYPMFFGGGQERGYRPGTENTCMIAGLGKASELVINNLDQYHKTMKNTRDYLETSLVETFGAENINFNGKCNDSVRLPNTCNFSFVHKGMNGHKVLAKAKYVQAAVGAACHSQSSISKVLLNSGISENFAINAIRLSTGRHTTREDVDYVIKYLQNAYDSLKN